MEPQDDPEARIRELERPLTDVARTSELGAPQPVSSIPPMPPPYTAPFPAPQRATASIRWIWGLFALIAMGVVALVVGIVVYTAHQVSRDGFTVGSPSLPQNPRSEARAPATPSPGSQVSIAGFDKNETIVCDDNLVSVSGFSNTIVITGHCASLTVSGSDNTVTVDTADTIDASGVDNHVTFHSGSPLVQNSGVSNVVEQG